MLPEAKLHDFLSVTLDSFTNLCMSHFLNYTMALECNQSQLIQSHKALIKMYLTKHLFINVMESSRDKYNCVFLFLVRSWGVAYNKEYLFESIVTSKHSLLSSCYRYSWLVYCIIMSIFKHKSTYINKNKLNKKHANSSGYYKVSNGE